MLTPQQIDTIPRTTRNDWNKFKHHNYYGYEIAKDYIKDLDYIKEVLTSKHLRFGLKLICNLSFGYKHIISEVERNKKLLRDNAERITYSIKRVAQNGKIKLSDACAIFGVSRDWFYRHQTRSTCTKSLLKKCFRQYPNQLTYEEVQIIEAIVTAKENQGKTKTTLYFDAIRKGILTCGRSTFFKYADKVGYKKLEKNKVRKRYNGFKAKLPFECLHVDVTHIQTKVDGVQYVAFVKDNFSGALLHVKSASEFANSHFIRELFKETFSKYKLLDQTNPVNIISDGGSENKGALLEWIDTIDSPPMVRKIIAGSSEFPFSNSMSERTHSIYKTEFMRRKHSYDKTKHLSDLKRFINYYNYERFPTKHHGLTVMEVLNGKKPDKNYFKSVIQEAKSKRLEINRAFNQCPVICK